MNYKEAVEGYIDILNSTRPFASPYTRDRFTLCEQEDQNRITVQIRYQTEEGSTLFLLKKDFIIEEELLELVHREKVVAEFWQSLYKELVRYSILGKPGELTGDKGNGYYLEVPVRDLLTQKHRITDEH